LSRDTQPLISLEVIVPRITLPIVQAPPTTENTQMEPEEAVNLSILGPQGRQVPMDYGQEDIKLESSSHRKHRLDFRLFKFTNVPVAKPLLVGILRRSSTSRHKSNTPEQYLASDEYALHLEFVSTPSGEQVPPDAQPLLSARSHQVEITLDEEGVPGGYRVDGAEG